MEEPIWLSEWLVRTLHAESISRFGGTPGIRDQGLLQSALARPRNLHAYGGGSSIYELAATYGVAIIQNHAFIDGNKRAGLLAIRAFLFRNGHRFSPDQQEMVRMAEDVATEDVSRDQLADWIAANSVRR
ncbi:MAG: type II toxin-antitoxin system death-on-curing family toxin [Longimonas sp.]|uniref:type II toxin-antitoxin system death-on-curing family toxin n=1 Tax=Longimonas sp. TaxID=2039626 RepID=UPI00335E2574